MISALAMTKQTGGRVKDDKTFWEGTRVERTVQVSFLGDRVREVRLRCFRLVKRKDSSLIEGR